jgi:hypothetical protein
MKKVIGTIKFGFVPAPATPKEPIEHFLTVIGTMANEDALVHWYTKDSYKRAIKYTKEFLADF